MRVEAYRREIGALILVTTGPIDDEVIWKLWARNTEVDVWSLRNV